LFLRLKGDGSLLMKLGLQIKTLLPALVAILVLIVLSLPAAASSTADQTPTLTEGLLISASALSAGDSELASVDYTGCGGEIAPVINADFEQKVVYLINLERTARGLPPLKRVVELDMAARYHAYDLGQDNYFSHDTMDRVDGVLKFVCSAWDRIIPYYTPPEWQGLGETIAGGQATPQDVLTSLMGSEPHRDILLSPDMWEIGVGYYQTKDGRTYWVQDFGKRSSTYPLVINADAAQTLDQHVSLYVYGTWQEVRLRNDDGLWSAWMSFSPELRWELLNSAGNHTVWTELRTGTESVITSDSIYLGVTVPLTEVVFLPLAQH
jgi:uncharacterized protein YkwD